MERRLSRISSFPVCPWGSEGRDRLIVLWTDEVVAECYRKWFGLQAKTGRCEQTNSHSAALIDGVNIPFWQVEMKFPSDQAFLKLLFGEDGFCRLDRKSGSL